MKFPRLIIVFIVFKWGLYVSRPNPLICLGYYRLMLYTRGLQTWLP